MSEGETGDAVRLLDLVLEFFADGARWARGRYHDDQGRRCLVGAALHLGRKHRIPSDGALSFLAAAMPRGGVGLVYFNDHRCRDISELRRVILGARALALGEAKRRREAAAVERWLLRELDRERAGRAAGDDEGVPPIAGAAVRRIAA
jgi:hypothetical protein